MDATSSRRVEIEGIGAPPCKNPRHMSLPSFFQPRETIVNPPDLCPNPPTIRCLSALSLSLSEAIVATDTRALCRDACAHPRGHFTNYREGSGATIGKSIGGIFIFIEWWRLNRRGSIRVRMAD